MSMNVTQKLIKWHLLHGDMKPGEEIGIRIDKTLTQDATGTLVMLELEAMDLDRVKTEVSVQYVDHNIIQEDFTRSRPIASSSSITSVPVASWVSVWSMRIPISSPGFMSPCIRCDLISFCVTFMLMIIPPSSIKLQNHTRLSTRASKTSHERRS